MSGINAEITYRENKRIHRTKGQRLIFSAHRCFALDGGPEDRQCLATIENFLRDKKGLAVAGSSEFTAYLLAELPQLKKQIQVVIQDDWRETRTEFSGLPVCNSENIPSSVQTVFIAETLTVPRRRWRKKLGERFAVFDTDLLVQAEPLKLPLRAWSQDPDTIYPIDIPEIHFESGKDFILIDCPSRNLALMPNGLAYVHNALKKTSLNFQTVDLDIIIYHRYHTLRLMDARSPLLTPTGREMHADPWLTEAYHEWLQPDTLAFFTPDLEEIVHKLIAAKPKILGVSVQGCNIDFTRELVRRVKAECKETIIVAGGYSCYQPNVGLRIFPEADYMCIGEADLTVGPLLEALAKGEFPRDTPGVLSVYDTPKRKYVPGGMPHELDSIEMARYDWTDLNIYRNHNHFQLTPIIATRGCRWSKCTFCGERFFWRARSPKLVVDEFEYFHDHGCDTFVFNESDLNGNPQVLLEICKEIVRRRLKVRLNGQLRINRHSDRKFFDALYAGGFTVLRFGVDAWSENTLKLQKKGYTVPMIIQNLKDCREAGIFTEVNTVIGIPHETEDDIERMIELKGICKPYVGRVANINKLMLINGSVYWEEPEKTGIKFRGGTKEELYAKFPSMIPAEHWYSDDPYIDEEVRVARFRRVVEGLGHLGFNIGAFAKLNIDKIDGEFAKPESAAAPEAKEDVPELRVDSVMGVKKVSVAPPSKVLPYGNEFYGLFQEKSKAAPEPAAVPVAQAAPSAVLDNVKGVASPPGHQYLQQVQHILRTINDVWKLHGPRMVLYMIMTRLNNKWQSWKYFFGLREGSVVVRRDYTKLIEITERHPTGYVILKARDGYYGIHGRTPFDKERADRGDYPEGICFRGINGRSVIEKVEEYTGYMHPESPQSSSAHAVT